LSLEACVARRSQRIRDGIDIAGGKGDQGRQRNDTQRSEFGETHGENLLHEVKKRPRRSGYSTV
jgi:hypothetical protein